MGSQSGGTSHLRGGGEGEGGDGRGGGREVPGLGVCPDGVRRLCRSASGGSRGGIGRLGWGPEPGRDVGRARSGLRADQTALRWSDESHTAYRLASKNVC